LIVSGLFARFSEAESGATAIEYALISALVGIGIVAALSSVRGSLIDEFASTATALNEANAGS
jgi:pilus assembly protein Flp/PilA